MPAAVAAVTEVHHPSSLRASLTAAVAAVDAASAAVVVVAVASVAVAGFAAPS